MIHTVSMRVRCLVRSADFCDGEKVTVHKSFDKALEWLGCGEKVRGG